MSLYERNKKAIPRPAKLGTAFNLKFKRFLLCRHSSITGNLFQGKFEGEYSMRNNKDNIIELNMITREQLEKNILCRSRMPDKIKERSKVRDAFVKNLTTSLQSDDFGIASASLIKELYDYFYFGSRTNRMKEQATNKQGAAYLLIEGVYHISRINQEIYALKNKLFLLEGGACQ